MSDHIIYSNPSINETPRNGSGCEDGYTSTRMYTRVPPHTHTHILSIDQWWMQGREITELCIISKRKRWRHEKGEMSYTIRPSLVHYRTLWAPITDIHYCVVALSLILLLHMAPAVVRNDIWKEKVNIKQRWACMQYFSKLQYWHINN